MKVATIKSLFLILALLLGPVLVAAGAPSPADVQLYFITPNDGDTVTTTFTVRFGLRGMGIAPAGTEKENTGHHHLLIDGKGLPEPGMPMGQNVKHFGGGQTEAEITLEPGTHTLQLILGDKGHVPHDPPVVSEKITVIVK